MVSTSTHGRGCKIGVVLLAAFLLSTCASWASATEDIRAARIYRIGVLAKSGVQKTRLQWGPLFDDYLNSHPTINATGASFELVPLLFDEVFDAVGRGLVDFTFVNSGFYACLEAQHGLRSMATLLNKRGNAGYDVFGGVVFAKKDRDDINSLTDAANKIMSSVSFSSFGGLQMQFDALVRAETHPLVDVKELRFANTHGNVVKDVLNGDADIGTVRTDTLERFSGFENGDWAKHVKIINPQTHPNFNFQISTNLYPEWPIAVAPTVDNEIASAVLKALLDIPTLHPAAVAGKFLRWVPSGSYTPVHDALKIIDVMANSRCHQSANLYDAIVCPAGTFRFPKDRLQERCASKCPEGRSCLCQPCVACPVGATCPGGHDMPVAQKDYWSEDRIVFYKCITGSCNVPPIEQQKSVSQLCADEDRVGFACSTCRENHFQYAGRCYQCPSETIAGPIIMTAIFLLVVALGSLKIAVIPMTYRWLAVASLVVIQQFQLLGAILNYEVAWPSFVSGLNIALGLISLDMSLFGASCAMLDKQGFVYQKISAMLIPAYLAAALLLIILVFSLMELAIHQRITEKLRTFSRFGIQAFLVLLQIAYVPVIFAAALVIPCYSHPNGDSSMFLYPAMSCDEGNQIRPLAYALLVVWGLGFPVVLYFITAKFERPVDSIDATELSHDDVKRIHKFGFYILGVYKSKFKHYDSMFLLRDVLFGLVPVFGTKPHIKLFLSLLVMMFFLVIGGIAQPFLHPRLNRLDQTMSMINCFVIVTGMLLAYDNTPDSVKHISVSLVVLVLLLGSIASIGLVTRFWRKVHVSIQKVALVQSEDRAHGCGSLDGSHDGCDVDPETGEKMCKSTPSRSSVTMAVNFNVQRRDSLTHQHIFAEALTPRNNKEHEEWVTAKKNSNLSQLMQGVSPSGGSVSSLAQTPPNTKPFRSAEMSHLSLIKSPSLGGTLSAFRDQDIDSLTIPGLIRVDSDTSSVTGTRGQPNKHMCDSGQPEGVNNGTNATVGVTRPSQFTTDAVPLDQLLTDLEGMIDGELAMANAEEINADASIPPPSITCPPAHPHDTATVGGDIGDKDTPVTVASRDLRDPR